jgi:hypothetical protein
MHQTTGRRMMPTKKKKKVVANASRKGEKNKQTNW